MFADEFKSRYTTIPFAYYKHKARAVEIPLFTHHHKELELIAIYDGEADFYIDSTCYSLKTGEVLVIPPYCIHRAIVSPGTSYDCICFDLSILWDNALRRELEEGTLTVKRYLSHDCPYTPDMHRCVRNAIRACEENAPGWEMDAIGNLSILFGQLKRDGFFVRADTKTAEHNFDKTVTEYVTEHFAEPITSSTVARELYINNSYFCRLFKKRFGTCFADYLLEYRIERAKFYINNTNDSISEIALKTGFNSFSYFSKVFKRFVGMTPSEFKRSSADRTG